MGRLCERMTRAARRVWRWFFPKRIDPPECVLELLRFVYPTVDWSRVSFYEGWPHVLGFSPNAAITLPDTYSAGRINVHVKPGRWNLCDCRGLGLIVHEGFHVLQIRDMAGGWGPGFARPFIVQYLACWAANGFKYDNHPMEDAAYAVAGRSTSLYETCCNAGRRLPCDCSADPPSVDTAGLAAFRADCGHVVQQSSGGNFWTDLAHCTPGLMALRRAAQRLLRYCRSGRGDDTSEPETGRPSGPGTVLRGLRCGLAAIGAGLLYLVFGLYYAVWLLLWSLVTLVLWLVKMLVEVVGAIVAGVMWVLAGLVCGLYWLWNRLRDLWRWFRPVLDRACRWAQRLERRCTEWEEQRRRRCTQTKEEREKRCTQTKEEREKNCCTWRPCSWACSAWTWVTNVVCVAWTWVTHVVCVAWTWVVTRTCKAFTWVVRTATCW